MLLSMTNILMYSAQHVVGKRRDCGGLSNLVGISRRYPVVDGFIWAMGKGIED